MKPTSLVFDGDRLTLCFPAMLDAVQFVESQFFNPEARAGWTFSYNPNGGALAITESRAVLHLP